MANILFVTQQFYPDIGGLARSGMRIANSLVKLGHRVHVFVLTSALESGTAESEELDSGLIVHRFGKASKTDFSLQQSLIFLEWLHVQNKFDRVWCHYAFHNGFMGIWFAKRLGIESILSVRGNDVDRQVFPPGDLSRLQWSLTNAGKIVAVSNDLAVKIKTLVDRESIVLHNSIDTEIFAPGAPSEELNLKYGLRPEELVMVFCGELRAKKGLSLLIECYRRVALRRPAKLLIIGAVRGKDRGSFDRETAAIDNVAQHIVCTGHLTELREVANHLRLGDVFLLPSLWDGLPNSLLEAMSIGLPVVASDAGAIGEVVTNGDNGILIPKTHLHRMAERIDEFFAKPAAERNAMISSARKYVVENHSPALELAGLKDIIGS